MIFSKTTVTILALLVTPLVTHAQSGDNKMGSFRGLEHSERTGRNGDDLNRRNERDGDHAGGGGGRRERPGFPGDAEIELTTIACDTELACERRNGESGTFVCRGLFHPITGVEENKALCIGSDEAWITDDCGCCGGECPEKPNYMDFSCDGEPDQDAANIFDMRHSGDKLDDVLVICRDLINPFTGVETAITIPIPSDKAIEGDICGCCNGECPEEGDRRFVRPDFMEKTCAVDALITCNLPGRADEDKNEKEGIFVCRTMYNVHTGMSKEEALCVASNRTWGTDECGCCGAACPERPRSVDIECSEAQQTCELRNGEDGLFVCRSIFHPFDGAVEETSLCIPSDKAWVTDDCGCCTDAGCPDTPEDGFDDEDTQLTAFALEATGEAHATLANSSGASSAMMSGLGHFLLTGIAGLFAATGSW